MAMVAPALVAACSVSTKTVAGPTTTAYATRTHEVSVTITKTRTVTTTPVVRKVVATHTRTMTVTYTPPPPHQYGAGTYLVGRDIQAGTYHSSGSPDCYWARLSDLSGGVSSIISNHLGSGPQYVEISSSDKAFQVQGGCTFGRA